ncbi:hypothetical protein N7516_007300 [Penicillium verrucosum]|uniref:uncharacterized protein n=1 Tax=Penicillium verrucosum TaxID=60171 RepID=UPI0025450746|nr:uncharacterized protein N7516_007300 [Penicillium verrucosum]KAJ5932811.1 hypothetical protein N7516_007300 [Penicillium verrucosum]
MAGPSPSPDNATALSTIETIYTQPLGASDPTFQRVKQALENRPPEERYNLQWEIGEMSATTRRMSRFVRIIHGD